MCIWGCDGNFQGRNDSIPGFQQLECVKTSFITLRYYQFWPLKARLKGHTCRLS